MSLVNKPYTFSSGATIIAAEHNDNFDTLYNDYNGNITNANVSNSAAIAESKLDLSTIAQDVTFTGTVDFTTSTIVGFDTTEVTSDVIFLNETTAPTTAANQGALYTKETSGATELFFREESDGTEVQITNAGALSSGGGIEVFTSDDTWTAPAGITQVLITLVGAGGGGGRSTTGNCGGGGGGETKINYPYAVTPESTYTIQVGIGGIKATSANQGGGNGEDSIFDTGGVGVTAEGGGGSSQDTGGPGGGGWIEPTASASGHGDGIKGGDGNDSHFAGGSVYGSGGVGASQDATGYGGGGYGANAGTQTSSSGSGGFVIVMY